MAIRPHVRAQQHAQERLARERHQRERKAEKRARRAMAPLRDERVHIPAPAGIIVTNSDPFSAIIGAAALSRIVNRRRR